MDELVQRVAETLELADGRYPVAADPRTGEWTWWSDDGWWTGGFWVGLLRLVAVRTGESRFVAAADEAQRGLVPRAAAPTLLRGFLFWYGDALGEQLGQSARTDAALTAADALAADLDDVGGIIPPGTEDAEQYDWPRPGACIDGLPGTVPLLYVCGHESVAGRHVEGSYRFCVRDDGSVSQDATYDDQGQLVERVAVNGVRPDSTWSRAQAWSMLGLAQAAVRDDGFMPAATAVTDWWCSHVPADLVAAWDFDDAGTPSSPRDTSATAIAAAAMVKLGRREEAEQTVQALRDRIGPSGGLVDGCFNRKKDVAVRAELVWGDYFLLEADLALHHGLDSRLL